MKWNSKSIQDKLWDKKKWIVIALVAVILFAYVPTVLSLVPGPEGVRTINYGVQMSSGANVLRASKLDALPSGFKWVSTQPSVMTVEHQKTTQSEPFGGMWLSGPEWYYTNDGGQVRSEVQRAQLTGDPLSGTTKTLEYYKYVQINETKVQIKKVVVNLVPAEFILQLSIVPGKGVYTWEGQRLWYTLDTVTWMNAYASSPPADPDPLTNDTTKLMSSNYRGAFPIFAWVDEYKDWVWTDSLGNMKSVPPDTNAASFVQLDPSLEGRTIDLYTSPSQTYDLMLNSEILTNPALLEAALKPDSLPDPRFAQTVYTYITLSHFGAYVKPTGPLGGYSSNEIWYPSIFYELRVVYALYGEYVYLWTKQAAQDAGYDDDEWQVRNTTHEVWDSPISSFIKGLQSWFGQNALFIWLIIGVAVIFVIYMLLPRRREPGAVATGFKMLRRRK